MSDDDAHITRRELEEFRDFIDERFKTHRAQMLLAIGVAVGLIRFDLPTPVTATALVALCFKGILSVVAGWRL
jgi:hypothetical protein